MNKKNFKKDPIKEHEKSSATIPSFIHQSEQDKPMSYNQENNAGGPGNNGVKH